MGCYNKCIVGACSHQYHKYQVTHAPFITFLLPCFPAPPCCLCPFLELLPLPLQPPPPQTTTEEAFGWTVELRLGTSIITRMFEVNITTEKFFDLQKGTSYTLRVAGENSRGLGTFSNPVVAETHVDSKFQHAHSCRLHIALCKGTQSY